MKPAVVEKAGRFPSAPGVYIFSAADGKALYVGKAANLRARVRSYLRPGADGRDSVRFLEGEAADVEFVVTSTEQEALLLENTVIKKRKPRYNIKLKDDKAFLLLRLDRSQPWPWFTLVRRRRGDGAEYFGPYASAKSVRRTLHLLHKIVPLRDCTDGVFHNRSRPCLKHQIGRCPAPCVGLIDRPAYHALLDRAVSILKGGSAPLLRELESLMREASAAMDYERAQAAKVQLEALEAVAERQSVVGGQSADRDVLGVHRAGDDVTAVFLLFRGGLLESSRRFGFRSDLPDPMLLADLVTRFYEGDCYVPEEVLVPAGPIESQMMEEWLTAKRGRRVKISVPARGDRRRQLMMAADNARLLDAAQADEEQRRALAARELARVLGCDAPPELIHCLDVSTMQGTSTVASRVCFRAGRPDRSRYRSFRISPAAAGDDFAALQEAVRRSLQLCLEKEDGELPDLLLVDGGRGQLKSAQRAMAELGIGSEVRPAGLAKSRLRGVGDRRRGTGERLFLPSGGPLGLARGAPETLLVTALRDEAHRFAITYHRKLRGKMASALDGIDGVGPGRRKLLLRHFGSLSGVQAAALEDLRAVPGLPARVAEAVYTAFKDQGLQGRG